MTQDEIIEMAKQCGIVIGYPKYQDIEAFAKLVAAKEREACATVCDSLLASPNTGGGWSDATIECSVQIRARGDNQ